MKAFNLELITILKVMANLGSEVLPLFAVMKFCQDKTTLSFQSTFD